MMVIKLLGYGLSKHQSAGNVHAVVKLQKKPTKYFKNCYPCLNCSPGLEKITERVFGVLEYSGRYFYNVVREYISDIRTHEKLFNSSEPLKFFEYNIPDPESKIKTIPKIISRHVPTKPSHKKINKRCRAETQPAVPIYPTKKRRTEYMTKPKQRFNPRFKRKPRYANKTRQIISDLHKKPLRKVTQCHI